MATPGVFEYKKPLAFPRIIGCYDTGSENYEKIRHRACFKSAIRFIEDPSVALKYPKESYQVMVGVVRYKDKDIWTTADSILPANTFGLLIFDDNIVTKMLDF